MVIPVRVSEAIRQPAIAKSEAEANTKAASLGITTGARNRGRLREFGIAVFVLCRLLLRLTAIAGKLTEHRVGSDFIMALLQ